MKRESHGKSCVRMVASRHGVSQADTTVNYVPKKVYSVLTRSSYIICHRTLPALQLPCQLLLARGLGVGSSSFIVPAAIIQSTRLLKNFAYFNSSELFSVPAALAKGYKNHCPCRFPPILCKPLWTPTLRSLYQTAALHNTQQRNSAR